MHHTNPAAGMSPRAHRHALRKQQLAMACCLALAFPLAAQAQATKLTLGHGAAPGNPRHEAAVKFAEVVKAKSAGRIEVQVAPSAQLGDDAAMVTAVRPMRSAAHPPTRQPMRSVPPETEAKCMSALILR